MNDYKESAGIQEDSKSYLQSMPDDNLRYVSGFEAADSDDTHDNEVSLHSRLGDMESSIVQKVSDEIKFVTLKKELFKVIKSEVAKKVQVVGLEGVREDLQSQTKHISKYCSYFQNMQTQLQDVKELLESAGEHQTAENITPPEPTPKTQGELAYNESTLLVSKTKVNEESAMVLYDSEKKDLKDLTTSEQDLEDDDDLDKQPLSKRFKIMHPIPSKPQLLVKQFTDQLFGTTSLKFLPTPPREPTPPRDEPKGKGIDTEEPLKDIMPFIEKGGSVPKIPNLKSFILLEGTLSQEKFMAQIKELKRLSDLKEHEKKSEEELKKILNPATIKAQALK
ncbi:hypothetical protein Tco_0071412 [Tanacetum coccineum]